MKVLLQNTNTSRFLREDGKWVGPCSEAKVFASSFDAIKHSIAHHLQDVQMLLHFDSAPRYDIAIGLGETSARTTHRMPKTLVREAA